MLKYIFKILILLLPLFSIAQDKLERQFFIRPGIDLSRFAIDLLEDSKHSAIELNLDCELKYRFFPIIEGGMHSMTDNKETYNYSSKGNYLRLGLNYNMLNYRQRFDRNIFFIGFRYGVSAFSHEATSVTIINEWGEYNTSIDSRDLNYQWAEGVIGLKGEILKNLYLGYTFRFKQKIKSTDFKDFTPQWVPGFGKGIKSTTMGMSYSISYAIPIKNPKANLPNKN